MDCFEKSTSKKIHKINSSCGVIYRKRKDVQVPSVIVTSENACSECFPNLNQISPEINDTKDQHDLPNWHIATLWKINK